MVIYVKSKGVTLPLSALVAHHFAVTVSVRLHGVSPADPEALTKAVMAARSGLVYVKIKDEDDQQVESGSSKDSDVDAK